MGWKFIKGRHYYYECSRESGKVKTTYQGNGEHARLSCQLNQIMREEREEQAAEARAAEQEELRAMAEEDARVARFDRWVGLLFQAEMEAAGYHRHARGAWRRRRMSMTETPPALTGPNPPRVFTDAECEAIVARGQAGDMSAIPEIQLLLKSPHRPRLLYGGNPAVYLDNALIKSAIHENSLVIKEAMHAKVKAIRADLTPPDAGPLETLLASRVATCWLAVCLAEIRATNRVRNGTPREMEAHARRVDAAHRRFLSAAKALADFRKIAPPNVLLNLVNQQAVLVDSARNPERTDPR